MKIRYVKWICFTVGLLFVFSSVFALKTGIEKKQEYDLVHQKLVQIPATVSRIVVSEDIDGYDEDYTAQVSYTYNNETYVNKYWKTTSEREYGVGQKVTITVNPYDPDVPYTYRGNITTDIVTAILFFAIGCGMMALWIYQCKQNPDDWCP